VFRDLLTQKLGNIAHLSEGQLAVLEAHYELLVRWNRKLNLTSIEERADAVERHYGESIFLAVHLPAGRLRIADVGSGGGFPGVPVAIVRPDCEVTLIESHRRKAVFLREATRAMANVRVVAVRAEEVEEWFDRIISRAVGYEDLAGTLKYLAPAADLLTGAEEPPAKLGFRWKEPVGLPWGKNRLLRSGVRIEAETRIVSRGTGDLDVSRETSL
jgi:16S rRNA (guanine527-N7)-methyltransferase